VGGKSSELDISGNNSRDCGGIAFKNRGNIKLAKLALERATMMTRSPIEVSLLRAIIIQELGFLQSPKMYPSSSNLLSLHGDNG